MAGFMTQRSVVSANYPTQIIAGSV
jgi:hypothetical protein